jgi:hypothetical protein
VLTAATLNRILHHATERKTGVDLSSVAAREREHEAHRDAPCGAGALWP